MKYQTTTIGSFVSARQAHIQTGPFGTQLKASNYVESGTPVINVRNIGYGSLIQDKLEFVNEDTKHRLSVHLIQKGDIVFGRKGAVDRHLFVSEQQANWMQGSDCIRLRFSSEKINTQYISCAFLSETHRKWMLTQSGNKATMASLNQNIIKRINIYLPPLIIQNKIAGTISYYDDLINVNGQRIQLLEETARLLFREWFVYFKFLDREKVKIVDRGGRNMPAEWEYLPFAKVKLFKKAPLGVPVFTDTRQYCQTSEIDGTSITGKGEEVDYESRPSRADIAPRINTVYFAKMKDTDKVLYFNKGNSDLLEKILLSTGMVGFTTEEKYLGFLFGLLTSYEFVQYKNNFATGATQVSLNDASLKKIKVLLPTLNLVELYSV